MDNFWETVISEQGFVVFLCLIAIIALWLRDERRQAAMIELVKTVTQTISALEAKIDTMIRKG